jgi:hypothetical protein
MNLPRSVIEEGLLVLEACRIHATFAGAELFRWEGIVLFCEN